VPQRTPEWHVCPRRRPGHQPYGVRIWEETGVRWTFRLVLAIHGAGKGKSRWSAYARRRVEDDLSDVLTEIRRRATAVSTEREARQLAEERRSEQERQRVIIGHRDNVLRAQVAAWRRAIEIRSHCDELVAAGMPADDGWLAWVREYADSTDPLRDLPGMPADPVPADDALSHGKLPLCGRLPPCRQRSPGTPTAAGTTTNTVIRGSTEEVPGRGARPRAAAVSGVRSRGQCVVVPGPADL